MRRTLVAGVVAAALVSVAGCGADEPRPRIAEPTASSSATESPSTDPGAEPQVESGPPDLSDEAQQPTLDGAVAFTKYFWDVANYAQKSGDTSGLEGIVNDGCEACQGAIRSVKRTTRPGYVVDGGDARVVSSEAETFNPSEGQTGAAVAFRVRNAAQTISRNGTVLDTFDASTVAARFLMTFTANGWRVNIWSFDDQQPS